jgi:HAD superfamily hydrolase (TIGR01509 family)
MPKAVLWDFDGTLVDTSMHWRTVEQSLIRAAGGGEWTEEQSANIHGFSMKDGAAACIAYAGREGELDPEWGADLMEREFLEILAGGDVEWRPGALALIRELEQRGVPQAVVSASSTPILSAAMATLHPSPFSAVVGGDAVANGKPHPEPYLTAAGLLGASPSECVAFEDSREGRRSAEAAGCFVVAIHFNYPHDQAPGRMPVDSLKDLPWDSVVAEFGRWSASR